MDATKIPLAPVIQVRDLSVRLRTASGDWRPVVSDVSLRLDPDSITGLLGESGAGKTTLALALLDLLPKDRYRVTGVVEHRSLRHASIIFQDPLLALNPVLTASQQVGEVLRAHGQSRSVEALLELAGLPPAPRILGAYPHQLSGGERQRVTIAQALAAQPDLIIADEPFSALDGIRALELASLFRDLQGKTGISFLLISHNPDMLARLAGWVLVMQQGRIVEQGPPSRILHDRSHPYTASLVQPFPRRTQPNPSTSAEPILRVENLSKIYSRPPARALCDVSLRLQTGSVLGIVGRSGSGKSTLARCLAGQEEPTSGVIHLDRTAVQLIPQQPAASLNPRFTAAEIVVEPLAIQGRGSAPARRDAAVRWMEMVGLLPAASTKPALDFSGGERQRLAIARALAIEPRLLILDESFSGLDRNLQAQLAHLLLDLQQRLKLTLILISHDLTVVGHLADEIAVMESGAIVEQGSATQILSNPAHSATRELFAASFALRESA